jgi:hypothetical protein
MITRFRGTAGLTILVPVLLSACSPAASNPGLAANSPSAGAMVPAAPAKPMFTLNTPVDRIAADPQGKAVLDRDVPGLMSSKDYPMFDDMSLSEIALVSGGRLTKSKLDLVQSDLIQISYLAPGAASASVIPPVQWIFRPVE